MSITSSEILSSIPEYPAAISAAVLAISLGFIEEKVKSGEELERGMRKLERKLSWITAADERLVERRTVTQDSTIIELRKAGLPDEDMPEEMSYLSLLGREKGKEGGVNA